MIIHPKMIYNVSKLRSTVAKFLEKVCNIVYEDWYDYQEAEFFNDCILQDKRENVMLIRLYPLIPLKRSIKIIDPTKYFLL